MKLPPAPPPSGATATMKANRGRDTGPEIALRRILHARGLRYRLGQDIEVIGRRIRPDLVFRARRVAVFVDGCYWHRCPDHGRMPLDPTGYWLAKLNRNVQRDLAVNEALLAAGWRVVRVWEHNDAETAADEVVAAVRD